MRNQKPIIPYIISYPVSTRTRGNFGKKVVAGLALVGGGYLAIKIIGFVSFLIPVALLGVAGYVGWKLVHR